MNLCECGCGQETSIAKTSNKTRDWIRGKPIRFVSGHNSLGKKGPLSNMWKGGVAHHSEGYALIYIPGHKRANPGGYVFDHVLIAEKALGKPLPDGVVVHHFPDKKDFTHLVICQDGGYHSLLHRRARALKASGNANWRKCYFCHKYDSPQNLHIANYFPIYHPSCKAIYEKARQGIRLQEVRRQ